MAAQRDRLNSALGQWFLDLSIVVDGPLLGKTVSKTVSQNYAFDQGGEYALILMLILVRAEIFTRDFMILNAYESDSIKVLLPIILKTMVHSFVPVLASAEK